MRDDNEGRESEGSEGREGIQKRVVKQGEDQQEQEQDNKVEQLVAPAG